MMDEFKAELAAAVEDAELLLDKAFKKYLEETE